MEKNKKDEELQSRRMFFKKAASGVLPLLGVSLLGASTLSSCRKDYINPDDLEKIINRRVIDTCNGACTGSCSASCSGSCDDGCSGDCDSGCEGYYR